MSGNLSGTYQSFLARCMDGVRKEQKMFREFSKVTQQLEAFEERGKALGLPDGWMFEGMGEVAESYRKGKEAFEREGDVYAVLSPLKNLVQHHEKALQMRTEELQKQEEAKRKREQEAEEERRLKREQEEEEAKRRKREQQEAEERQRVQRAAAMSVMKSVLPAGCLVLVAALGWNWLMQAKSAGETKTRAENTRRTLYSGKTAGETKTITLPGGARMAMVWCPKGSFMMGSPSGEQGRGNDETQHRVTLTKGFWMAKTEVTQKQWLSVMGTNPSKHRGDNLPVESVSWDDCQAFCKKTGLALPTEAQWEYACRAGSTGPYAGSGNLDEMGWFESNSGKETHPVGQKKPNAWGLHDMHGNVWEWCADWKGSYPNGAVQDPAGVSFGSERVERGGSWSFNADYCRSAYRDDDRPSAAWDCLGFRPVSSLSE